MGSGGRTRLAQGGQECPAATVAGEGAMTKKADAAVLERDANKRRAMYEEMQADFRKNSPFVMLFQQTEVAAMRSDVQGLKIGPTSDSTYMHKVTK